MKIRHAFAGLLAVVAMVGVAPSAVAATPTAAGPGNIYTDSAPAPDAQAAAATCPAQGHRIKVSTSATVYLVGPGNVLYYFPSSTDYFGLYSSYSGISTVSSSVLGACRAQSPGTPPYALTDAHLDKLSGTPDVYIWDAAYSSFRWITSQSVFDRYGFAPSKLIAVSGLGPIGPNWS